MISYLVYFYNWILKNRGHRLFRENRKIRKESSEILPIPPNYLIYLVIGQPDVQLFLNSGRVQVFDLLLNMLQRNRLDLSTYENVLDFGCGCGRLLRHLIFFENVKFFGCDYNPLLIKWCKKQMQGIQFLKNQLEPPIDFNTHFFDLVIVRSIFTHLSADLQSRWLKEIHRIIKPNGLLWITFSGDYYRSHLSQDELDLFNEGRMIIRKESSGGKNDCAVFHPRTYVLDFLANGKFEVIDFEPGGSIEMAWQDSYLCRQLSN